MCQTNHIEIEPLSGSHLNPSYTAAQLFHSNNHKNQYFLQRIEPYPLGKGVFNNEIEIVSFIKKDISKFKAAKQLIDFDKFLNLNNKVADLTTKLEHLFLNYDVSSIDIEKLQSMLDSFGEEVNDLRKNSRKVK